MRVLKSPETAVHLVTLLEEMPVQETVDGIAELRGAELPTGNVIVNMVRPHVLDEAAVRGVTGDRRKEVAKTLTRAGVTGSAKLVTPLLEQAAEHAERVELEREQRSVLGRVGAADVRTATDRRGNGSGRALPPGHGTAQARGG